MDWASIGTALLPAAIGMGNQALGDPLNLSGTKGMETKRSDRADAMVNQMGQQQTATQGIADQSQAQTNPFITQLMQQMSGVASGQGPSAASAMLEASRSQNMANWNAMQASQRGNMSAGMSGGLAANQLANAQQGAASQIAPMAIQERTSAMNSMGSLIGQQQQYELQMRDLSRQYLMAGYNAETAQQMAQLEVEKQKQAGQNALMGNMMGVTGSMLGGMAKAGTLFG